MFELDALIDALEAINSNPIRHFALSPTDQQSISRMLNTAKKRRSANLSAIKALVDQPLAAARQQQA